MFQRYRTSIANMFRRVTSQCFGKKETLPGLSIPFTNQEGTKTYIIIGGGHRGHVVARTNSITALFERDRRLTI